MAGKSIHESAVEDMSENIDRSQMNCGAERIPRWYSPTLTGQERKHPGAGAADQTTGVKTVDLCAGYILPCVFEYANTCPQLSLAVHSAFFLLREHGRSGVLRT